MKEFTANQIAAALGGHPGSAEQELRLLWLFQTPTVPSPESGGREKEAATPTLPLRGREMSKAA